MGRESVRRILENVLLGLPGPQRRCHWDPQESLDIRVGEQIFLDGVL